MKGLFITGTDTDAGKTEVACAVIRELAAAGFRVAPFKPVAAGAEPDASGALRNADALALIEASGVDWDYDLVNPYCFAPPVAPHLAAQQLGQTIALDVLQAAAERLAAEADVLVVEGAGGWMVPLDAELDTAALARALGLPVLLVVGLRLGCLNHARLSARAIHDDGCDSLGWVASEIDPDMALAEENLASLEKLLGIPRLAHLPHRPENHRLNKPQLQWLMGRNAEAALF